MKVLSLLLLLLYYNPTNAFSSKLSVPDCAGECFDARATFLVYLSSLTGYKDSLNMVYMLLSHVYDCVNDLKHFHLSVYVAARNRWITCCSQNNCFRQFSKLNNQGLQIHLKNGLNKSVDMTDGYRMFEMTSLSAQMAAKENRKLFLLTDFIAPAFLDNSNSSLSSVNVMFLNDQLAAREQAQRYFRGTNLTILSSDDLVTNTSLAHSFCRDWVHEQHKIPVVNSTVIMNAAHNATVSCNISNSISLGTIPTDLRVFIAFSNLTPANALNNVITFIDTIVSDSNLRTNPGDILITGPSGNELGSCTWTNYTKCRHEVSSRTYRDITMSTDWISVKDIEFAPDVLGFMRSQALKSYQYRKTAAIVLSDFVSVEFTDNEFFFDQAIHHQYLTVQFVVVLEGTTLTPDVVYSYYSNLTSERDIVVEPTFADLGLVAQAIVWTVLYDGDSVTTAKSIPSTTILTGNGPLTSDPVRNTHGSESLREVVIAISLMPNVTEDDLRNLRDYLRLSTLGCINDNNRILIGDDKQLKLRDFCTTRDCLSDQIGTITSQVVHSKDTTIDLLEESMQAFGTFTVSNTPILVLVTNFVSDTFTSTFDSNQLNLRQQLSDVDFQVVLINSTQSYYNSSISNTIIHEFKNFSDLSTAKTSFCETDRAFPFWLLIWVLPTCLAIIAIAVVITVYCRRRKRVRNIDRASLMSKISTAESLMYYDEFSKSTISDDLSVASLKISKEDPWEMTMQQIQIGHEIGRGVSAVVFAGSIIGRAPVEFIFKNSFYAYEFDNKTVAIKKHFDTRRRHRILEEIEIMKTIGPHEHIVKMLGYMTMTTPIQVVLQYANQGDLRRFMRHKKIYNAKSESCSHSHSDDEVCWRDVMSYLWQIADAMAFISANQVIHRDVAARNMLLNNRTVLVSDFGLSIWTYSSSHDKSGRIPVKWTAPEALESEYFSEKSDVWSFGVCAWEIITSSKLPFPDQPSRNVRQFVDFIRDGHRLPKPAIVSEDLWSTISSCWSWDPNLRPTFGDIRSSLGYQLSKLNALLDENYGYINPTHTEVV